MTDETMTIPALAREAISGLKPIGLTQTESLAGLSERKDRKYLVDAPGLDRLILELGPGFRALDIDSRRSFEYESVYFDTPEYDSYMTAARRRPRRWKVRTRSYVDAELCNLELKMRRRNGNTVKRRLPYEFADRGHLTAEAHGFLAMWDAVDSDRLGPVSTVRYTRSTLVDTRAWSRVTLDTDLSVTVPGGESLIVDGFVLVETKSVQQSTAFDRLLWRHGYRPTSISKYCTLLAAIDPALPSNHWTRTLKRLFDQ